MLPALKKHGPQALGRSHGDFGTKSHGIVDTAWQVGRVHLDGRRTSRHRSGRCLLVTATDAQAVIADKGNDSDVLAPQIEARPAEAVIPPRGVPIAHCFALGRPALLSALSKKSFPSLSAPILACSALISIGGAFGSPPSNASAARLSSGFFHCVL